MTKVVTIEAKFPELKIKYMYQNGRGRGSTLQAAFGAATRDLLKQKGLKAKRFTMFTATISVGVDTSATEVLPSTEETE